MKIYILLPVHNRRELTRRFVECLKLQTYQNFLLVLIDDGSTDGTSEMVSSSFDGVVTVLKGDGTWWWAGALQQGYEWIVRNNLPGNDIVLICNDDTEIESNFFENAVRVLKHSSGTLLLAQAFDMITHELCEAGVRVDWQKLAFDNTTSPDEINCFSTRGLFMRVEDMLTIGGFHPVLLPHYLSDYEYTIRAWRKGLALITDETVCLNVNRDTSGIHYPQITTISELITNYFHKKSSGYLLAWMSFVLLTSPLKYVPINLLRVMYGIIYSVFKVVTGWLRFRDGNSI